MAGMVRVGEPILDRGGVEAWVLPMVEAALTRRPKPPIAPMAISVRRAVFTTCSAW